MLQPPANVVVVTPPPGWSGRPDSRVVVRHVVYLINQPANHDSTTRLFSFSLLISSSTAHQSWPHAIPHISMQSTHSCLHFNLLAYGVKSAPNMEMYFHEIISIANSRYLVCPFLGNRCAKD